MGVITYTVEEFSPVAPARLFKAMALDNHNFFPKAMPQQIKNVEFIKGSGEVGSIKQTNFHEGQEIKYAKHQLDAIDAEHFKIKYSLIDSNVFGDKLECIKYEVMIVPKGTGSDCKIKVHIHPKGDCVPPEEEVNIGKEKEKMMFKAVEGYLLAHPDCYA